MVEDHGRVVDYVLKTVLNGRLSYDEAVMVLPRSRGGSIELVIIASALAESRR